MSTALLVATLVCILATAAVAVADYLPAGFVLQNSAEVGVPTSALPVLGTLKLAGAAGLFVGLIAVPWLGVAAGIGLTLFFIGAVATHVKAKVFHNIAFPAAYLGLSIAATVCLATAAARP